MRKEFPKFWFEGNLYFNWVNSQEDLQKVFELYEGSMTPDEILDRSKNEQYLEKEPNYNTYGLRSEHIHGDKTLREYLEEHGIILHKEFIPVLFKYHHHGQLDSFDFECPDPEILYKEADVVKLIKSAIAYSSNMGYFIGINATEEEKTKFFIDKKELIQTITEGFIKTHGEEYNKILNEINETGE